MERHYETFDEEEENKLEYTTIFKEYVIEWYKSIFTLCYIIY